MLAKTLARAAFLLVLACSAAMACGATDEIPDGHFECGVHGGTCEAGAEICVIVDSCSTCYPAPTACGPDDGCTCLDGAADADPVLSSCHTMGACMPSGDGLEVTCTESEPMIGCG